MTPAGKGTNSTSYLKDDLCSFWPSWLGLSIKLFSFPPVNRKQTKFILDEQFHTHNEPQLGWSHVTNNLSIYQEESGHSFWEKLMRKAGARQLAELHFCLHIPQGRARRILTSGGTEMVCAAWIDYVSPRGGERSGICPAVIRYISRLRYNTDHLQPTVGTDGAALGQALLYIWEIPYGKKEQTFSLLPVSEKPIAPTLSFSTFGRTFGELVKRKKKEKKKFLFC